MRIRKILVANRGEIALRVMKTAKRLGISTVAVYSEADRNAPHVLFADQAYCIGPPASKDSYLNMAKILEAIKSTGADAVHPGYGFLSENAAFAEMLEDNGIIFIGPSAHSIEIMGDKLSSKDAVKSYNVPMVPGTEDAIKDLDAAKEMATRMGYPILIKASAGGGGKGMRVVEHEGDFETQMERAVSEAVSSFGNGDVFIEKYISSPRHIEIQILADKHGNVIHLMERECSIQRRHQKVVEEAPSPIIDEKLRHDMGKAAINVAKACQYHGVGTVEFLVDDQLNFYFLEMNTRLQVEHPVTEMITGIDLVEEQIRVAEDNKLRHSQEDIQIHGSSIELRVYAEDPENNFLPSIGLLQMYKEPTGNGIRVDSGFEEGMEIPIFYDPMISKLIVHGKNRNDAIEKMISAISDYQIEGVSTTLEFGEFVMNHPLFRKGNFDTHFVRDHFNPEALKNGRDQYEKLASILAAQLKKQYDLKLNVPKTKNDQWEQRKFSE